MSTCRKYSARESTVKQSTYISCYAGWIRHFLFNFVFPLYINQYKRPKQKTSHSFRLRSTIVPAKPMIKHAVVVSPTPPIPGWSDVLMWPWHTEMGLGVGVQRHDFRPLDEYRGERGTYLRSGFTGLRRLFQATRTTNTQSTMF